MPRSLRILLVEDREDDAELVLRELRRSGFAPDHLRVDTARAFAAALEHGEWDAILADFTMPTFTGPEALAILRGRGLDTPFIFISGSIGEDTAVDAMRAGAQDYLLKDNLRRLAPAMERELREAVARRERRVAEERLRLLSRAVDQSANLIVVIDAEQRVQYVNPAFLEKTGYDVAEVTGRKPWYWEIADATVPWPVVTAGGDWQGEVPIRRKDGTLLDSLTTLSPVRDEGGSIANFVAIQEDITDRKSVEEQLRRVQRLDAIGQMTGGLAHDFNNLLTIAMGNLDLLQEQLGDDPKARRLTEAAISAVLRGAGLTRQMLAFARRQSLTAESIDLSAIVRATSELLQRTLGEHVRVRLVLADDLWPAMADPVQMESALANLAINARDAMPGGGALTIETANKHLDAAYAAENVDAAAGDYVMLAVSDTGTGMAPDVLARVFEPFFTTKAPGKGTGLGLSMVYGFVKQSHGHVKIYSEVGHGTTIRIYLPRAHRASPAASERAPETATLRGNEVVLVVEDNEPVREVVTLQLADLGYRVITAGDGAQAMAILERGDPVDLMFTDVVMPGRMTGVELARAARRLRPGLKVLFTSGFAEASLQGETGAELRNLLSKPYPKVELARRVRATLRGEAD